jgi:hypothetical protein
VPAERPLHVPAPVGAELDVEHLDRQHVAALGALDMHRPGQDVPAEMRRELGQDLAVLGQHVHRRLGRISLLPDTQWMVAMSPDLIRNCGASLQSK